MTQPHAYSTGFKVGFWVSWLLAGLVFALFAMFAIITLDSGVLATDGWMIGLWNLLATVLEGFILIMTARAFFRRAKPASELTLWLALAVFAVPLLAFGGCAVVGGGLRMAG